MFQGIFVVSEDHIHFSKPEQLNEIYYGIVKH